MHSTNIFALLALSQLCSALYIRVVPDPSEPQARRDLLRNVWLSNRFHPTHIVTAVNPVTVQPLRPYTPNDFFFNSDVADSGARGKGELGPMYEITRDAETPLGFCFPGDLEESSTRKPTEGLSEKERQRRKEAERDREKSNDDRADSLDPRRRDVRQGQGVHMNTRSRRKRRDSGSDEDYPPVARELRRNQRDQEKKRKSRRNNNEDGDDEFETLHEHDREERPRSPENVRKSTRQPKPRVFFDEQQEQIERNRQNERALRGERARAANSRAYESPLKALWDWWKDRGGGTPLMLATAECRAPHREGFAERFYASRNPNRITPQSVVPTEPHQSYGRVWACVVDSRRPMFAGMHGHWMLVIEEALEMYEVPTTPCIHVQLVPETDMPDRLQQIMKQNWIAAIQRAEHLQHQRRAAEEARMLQGITDHADLLHYNGFEEQEAEEVSRDTNMEAEGQDEVVHNTNIDEQAQDRNELGLDLDGSLDTEAILAFMERENPDFPLAEREEQYLEGEGWGGDLPVLERQRSPHLSEPQSDKGRHIPGDDDDYFNFAFASGLVAETPSPVKMFHDAGTGEQGFGGVQESHQPQQAHQDIRKAVENEHGTKEMGDVENRSGRSQDPNKMETLAETKPQEGVQTQVPHTELQFKSDKEFYAHYLHHQFKEYQARQWAFEQRAILQQIKREEYEREQLRKAQEAQAILEAGLETGTASADPQGKKSKKVDPHFTNWLSRQPESIRKIGDPEFPHYREIGPPQPRGGITQERDEGERNGHRQSGDLDDTHETSGLRHGDPDRRNKKFLQPGVQVKFGEVEGPMRVGPPAQSGGANMPQEKFVGGDTKKIQAPSPSIGNVQEVDNFLDENRNQPISQNVDELIRRIDNSNHDAFPGSNSARPRMEEEVAAPNPQPDNAQIERDRIRSMWIGYPTVFRTYLWKTWSARWEEEQLRSRRMRLYKGMPEEPDDDKPPVDITIFLDNMMRYPGMKEKIDAYYNQWKSGGTMAVIDSTSQRGRQQSQSHLRQPVRSSAKEMPHQQLGQHAQDIDRVMQSELNPPSENNVNYAQSYHQAQARNNAIAGRTHGLNRDEGVGENHPVPRVQAPQDPRQMHQETLNRMLTEVNPPSTEFQIPVLRLPVDAQYITNRPPGTSATASNEVRSSVHLPEYPNTRSRAAPGVSSKSNTSPQGARSDNKQTAANKPPSKAQILKEERQKKKLESEQASKKAQMSSQIRANSLIHYLKALTSTQSQLRDQVWEAQYAHRDVEKSEESLKQLEGLQRQLLTVEETIVMAKAEYKTITGKDFIPEEHFRMGKTKTFVTRVPITQMFRDVSQGRDATGLVDRFVIPGSDAPIPRDEQRLQAGVSELSPLDLTGSPAENSRQFGSLLPQQQQEQQNSHPFFQKPQRNSQQKQHQQHQQHQKHQQHQQHQQHQGQYQQQQQQQQQQQEQQQQLHQQHEHPQPNLPQQNVRGPGGHLPFRIIYNRPAGPAPINNNPNPDGLVPHHRKQQ